MQPRLCSMSRLGRVATPSGNATRITSCIYECLIDLPLDRWKWRGWVWNTRLHVLLPSTTIEHTGDLYASFTSLALKVIQQLSASAISCRLVCQFFWLSEHQVHQRFLLVIFESRETQVYMGHDLNPNQDTECICIGHLGRPAVLSTGQPACWQHWPCPSNMSAMHEHQLSLVLNTLLTLSNRAPGPHSSPDMLKANRGSYLAHSTGLPWNFISLHLSIEFRSSSRFKTIVRSFKQPPCMPACCGDIRATMTCFSDQWDGWWLVRCCKTLLVCLLISQCCWRQHFKKSLLLSF